MILFILFEPEILPLGPKCLMIPLREHKKGLRCLKWYYKSKRPAKWLIRGREAGLNQVEVGVCKCWSSTLSKWLIEIQKLGQEIIYLFTYLEKSNQRG